MREGKLTNWQIDYANEKIAVNFGHVSESISTACSVLTKEICFNEKIKDNPAQKKAYEIHVSVLRLLEQVFKDGFAKFEEHQRKMIPRGKR
jgi:hypothetical protein